MPDPAGHSIDQRSSASFVGAPIVRVRPPAGAGPAAASGISGGDLTNAPTALAAATTFSGVGLNFLEAMDTAGWNFATAGPLRDALIAYFVDAQAELTVMISGAAGAQHRNASTYQEGRLRTSALPRPAPRPHPYAKAQHSAGAGLTNPGTGGIPGEITPTAGSERQQQMTDPSEAGGSDAGESDPLVPEFTVETARDLSLEELLVHKDRLFKIIGHYRRGGTDADRRQYEILLEEQHSRIRARIHAEREQKRLAAPPGAIDRARHLLTAGGVPPEMVESHIDFYVNRRWTGLFGAEITDEFWAREIRSHKISTGQLPTKKALKSRMSRAARAAGLSRQPSPQVLARKYLTDLEDIEIRLQRAIQRGNETQWRQDHPAEVVLLELAMSEPE